LRKVAAAALAVPVLAVIYLPVLARRPIAARLALLATVGTIVFVTAFGLARPLPAAANPPAPPISALTDDAFRSISTGTDLHAGVPIHFSEPMDAASVAAALTLEPPTAVELDWNADRTTLTVRPASHWSAGAYQVVTVEPGALAATGRPMAAVARAAFVTRPATTGRIQATTVKGDAASIATAFRLTFDRPVAASAVAAAVKLSPAAKGSVVTVAGRPDATLSTGTAFLFTPDSVLAPGTAYTVSVDSLVDLDGAPVLVDKSLKVTTTTAPGVVRFRPANGAKDVERSTALSVRFTAAMSHVSTRAAFKVTANGAPVAGTVSFAEGNTVLVFTPSKALPAGATVVMSVAGTATSVHGVPLAAPVTATIHTVAAAKPATTTTSTRTITSSSSSSAGKAVGGGSWGAVETYYLKLMNCTRTGGWVTSTGSCSSPGGRNVAALRLDSGISTKVSRPYAKKLAVNNLCTHFSGGNPGNRLSAAGYTSYIWAENLGCRSGNPYTAVLGSHLYFQSERSYNGGHYVNLMNSKYDRVGIGVWVSGGRVRLVIDFYHPR
jgi:uncharacterized protein YkwD